MSFNYNFPIKLNIARIPFRSSLLNVQPKSQLRKDGFVTNPIYESLSTKEQIELVVKSNSRIMGLLKEYSIPLQVNIRELEKLKQSHMKDTRIIAAKIYSSLPEELKKEVNLLNLQEAAMLHDYGKVLIPDNILNKAGRLNNKEQEIMELHSELGYELLKNKDLSKETLNLIKYHHQNQEGTGYPTILSDFEYNIGIQILSVADKYSALREKRCYKNPLAKYEALEIIAKDVNRGNVSQEVYTALLKSV